MDRSFVSDSLTFNIIFRMVIREPIKLARRRLTANSFDLVWSIILVVDRLRVTMVVAPFIPGLDCGYSLRWFN